MGYKVLGLIMAGGKGERLYPLTRDRAKPAVPFGGKYRIVDFVLSNFVNSGIFSMYVLTQFKSQSLTEHIRSTWTFGTVFRDQFITTVPAQMQRGENWYRGTADAVRQNLDLVAHSDPDIVAVFGADHVYRMDLSQMVDYHLEKNADITISALPVPRKDARSFGVIKVDSDWRVAGFQEKPARPATIPGEKNFSLASMGNYLFSTDVLFDMLEGKPHREKWFDFGKDILPRILKKSKVYAYDFKRNFLPGMEEGEENSYWRDVGTIDAYYESSMELRSVKPPLNLYNEHWPILSYDSPSPPAKFVFNDDDRRGYAVDSIIGSGTIVSGGEIVDSVIGRNVRVHSGCSVSESILMEGVSIGRRCRIRRAIIDKNVSLPPGTEIGFDAVSDKKKYYVNPSGIVIIPRNPKKLCLPEIHR